MDREHFKYTLKHRKAFLMVEKRLLGKNSMRGCLHDVDKLLLYLFSSPESKWVSNLHRKYSRHHVKKAKSHSDFVQMVIDWECARLTKPDKPLNAKETMNRIYPEMREKIEPVLKELNL